MTETKMPNEDVRAEIILYQSDGQDVPVQVHLMDDTLWMPQREIADLFETSQQNVSLRRGIVSLEDVSAAMRYLAPSLRAVLDLIRESGGAAVLPMSGELRELVDRRLLRASEGPRRDVHVVPVARGHEVHRGGGTGRRRPGSGRRERA